MTLLYIFYVNLHYEFIIRRTYLVLGLFYKTFLYTLHPILTFNESLLELNSSMLCLLGSRGVQYNTFYFNSDKALQDIRIIYNNTIPYNICLFMLGK